MFAELLQPHYWDELLQVIVVDLVMAGDNAIIVGLVAAGLPAHLRKKAIMVGIVAATVMRVFFALITAQLLLIVGLTFAGGLLLLWVAWKMWREIEEQRKGKEKTDVTPVATAENFRQAIIKIVVADVSMSLDNVLAVAGAAKDSTAVLVVGLLLSVGMMALASGFIAKLMQKHHWIAYIGLLVVAYIALDMIFSGGLELVGEFNVKP